MLDLLNLRTAVRYEGGISRRLFLAYGAALSAIPLLDLNAREQRTDRARFTADPFQLGVASGDPNHDGFVLWTRLAPHPLEQGGGMPTEFVPVRWEIAGDDAMRSIVRTGETLATPQLGHSVHVEVNGLEPDRWYWYRFMSGDAVSPVGRTRTMPKRDAQPDQLRFAFASCQNYETGLYTAYEHMAQDELDLVFHLGDYIYEAAPKEGRLRKHLGPKLKTLDDYRLRFSQYRADPLLHQMHARCPWVLTWDDHEVENNYADAISSDKDVDPFSFLEQRANAYQAYYEFMPLRPRSLPQGPNLKLYRTVNFGRLAAFQVLDTRQYRTDQPNDDEASELNDAALNPKNSMLGPEQAGWLKGALLKSQAGWNVLAQQIMMGMVTKVKEGRRLFGMDIWSGYAHERMKLLEFIANRKISNPVVLTGDIHTNWVNDLRVDDRLAETPVVATEFVGTSISSLADPIEDKNEIDRLFADNPCVRFHNRERGYVRCTLTPATWRSDFQVVEDVTKPGAAAVTRASFVIESGKPGAKPV